ncbi:hypothetical protein ACQEV2_00825 [Streptomyces sp. CA-251387]
MTTPSTYTPYDKGVAPKTTTTQPLSAGTRTLPRLRLEPLPITATR